jgi:hypothetical protein
MMCGLSEPIMRCVYDPRARVVRSHARCRILNEDTRANWNRELLFNVTRECSQSVRFCTKLGPTVQTLDASRERDQYELRKE